MVSDLVDAHVASFNAAVRSGSYDAFVAGLAPDAVVIFTGVVVSRSPSSAGVLVRFAWDHGGTGTMRLAWSDGRVVRLEIAFD